MLLAPPPVLLYESLITMNDIEKIKELLEKLTGQKAPFQQGLQDRVSPTFMNDGLGLSQLNEILLLLGFDRVSSSFFQYLYQSSENGCHVYSEYEHGIAFSSLDKLSIGINLFREAALIVYGNVKYAFKTLSIDDKELKTIVDISQPIDENIFMNRHDPILPIKTILPEDAYLTGYIIEKQLKARIESSPNDTEAKELEEKREKIVDEAKMNQEAYLTSDHLDVYVATSMRERHEFLTISKLTQEIFKNPSITPLKLRWFDPTQAYCIDRVDKGLSEALMLRRAACTIYLAQESDTLGKDSELASTLAQGKPVIAYVPSVNEEYLNSYFTDLKNAYSEKDFKTTLINQLKIFNNDSAWFEPQTRNWLNDNSLISEDSLKEILSKQMTNNYDKRAKTLKEIHPLGIQVNLDTGVANGVLVVRNAEDCANLIKRIITRTLEVELIEETRYTCLVEKISGCVFRVMTKDEMLTNAFWNFYLEPAE